MTVMPLADVALPVPVPRLFTYAVPGSLAARVAPGARVVCAMGTRRVVGVVLALREGEPPPKVKPLLSVVEGEPSVPGDLLAFLRDVAQYYLAPIGEVVRLALPPLERDVARQMEEPSLFARPSRGVGPRQVQWVTAVTPVTPMTPATAGAEAGAVASTTAAATVTGAPQTAAGAPSRVPPRGAQAAAILAHLRDAGPSPLARLAERWPNARSAVRRLVKEGLAEIDAHDAALDPFFAEAAPRDVPPDATPPQVAAISAIAASIAARRAGTFLLHGVTGSGKTEVYLRAIAAARAARVGVIVLVPEIALTPQLVARFRARFGDDVAVLHSGLTARERQTMWRRLHAGEVDVAIGARSALFAPVRALGLVIVDEEHDPSFKQEEGVRYHARDMAIYRAHRAGGVCVLGSATPSLESEHLVLRGKAEKLLLPDRARAQTMPRVEVVDLRRTGAGPTGDKRISLPLHRAIEQTLAAGQQTILFLNRRGFAPSVRCEACGEMCVCPACAVALTFHKRAGDRLRCHYCEHEASLPAACPKCGAPALALEGLGTEKLEDTLSAAFPGARVARLDRDVGSGRAVEKILERMRARAIDILVGTQMVAKGHDLPHVTLVGVINADAALSIPDFRAAERAFQLLVQVAGRAGRGEVPGRVLIQTYDPDHEAIVFARRHDVHSFLECELKNRRELVFPPFSRMAMVRVDGPDEREAREGASLLQRAAAKAASASGEAVDVKDVSTAPLARLRNRFRFRVVLRSADRAALRRTLLAVERAREGLPRALRSSIDVDPVQFL